MLIEMFEVRKWVAVLGAEHSTVPPIVWQIGHSLLLLLEFTCLLAILSWLLPWLQF